MRVEVIEGVKVIFRTEKHGSSAEMVVDGRKHRNAITGSRLEPLRQWVIETLTKLRCKEPEHGHHDDFTSRAV